MALQRPSSTHNQVHRGRSSVLEDLECTSAKDSDLGSYMASSRPHRSMNDKPPIWTSKLVAHVSTTLINPLARAAIGDFTSAGLFKFVHLRSAHDPALSKAPSSAASPSMTMGSFEAMALTNAGGMRPMSPPPTASFTSPQVEPLRVGYAIFVRISIEASSV
eukprot:CAMPEP_0195020910 /NCGR_PEP_ID=MMETSP0326_2-20130528/36584_1 /TAXON_ID=2866 ORGANISM="Crypthecodinium cohnii, Strain Seligo" /NCGR_SAMPLE_ID=MMETSP0326_2 /ASSEMBLY_ACC=CAM_ASM_000348 /LENGTH=161 /DNA_ID=CAMNT_0040039829 /DNA_START=208 /DNA_END=694 /DNA_ORIENTATION=+